MGNILKELELEYLIVVFEIALKLDHKEMAIKTFKEMAIKTFKEMKTKFRNRMAKWQGAP